MLSTDTFEKALELLELGYTFPSITEATGITTEDAEALHVAWFKGTTEQLFREVELAGLLELAAGRLRSGSGWDEGTTGDLLREILHVYPAHLKKAPTAKEHVDNCQVCHGADGGFHACEEFYKLFMPHAAKDRVAKHTNE
jgi:hypothetical protein